MTKVLVIDDDASSVLIYQTALQRAGFRCLTATTGLDGIEVVYRAKPDVVILDLMMPGMDGWEVCQEIRAFSQVPVIVVSAVIEADDIERLQAMQLHHHLVKPVHPTKLIALIEQLAAA